MRCGTALWGQITLVTKKQREANLLDGRILILDRNPPFWMGNDSSLLERKEPFWMGNRRCGRETTPGWPGNPWQMHGSSCVLLFLLFFFPNDVARVWPWHAA